MSGEAKVLTAEWLAAIRDRISSGAPWNPLVILDDARAILAALEAAQAPDAIVRVSAQRDLALDALVKAEKERDAALKDRDEAIARADGDRAKVREWRDAYWQLAAELSIVTTPETGAEDLARAIVERVREAEKDRDAIRGRVVDLFDAGFRTRGDKAQTAADALRSLVGLEALGAAWKMGPGHPEVRAREEAERKLAEALARVAELEAQFAGVVAALEGEPAASTDGPLARDIRALLRGATISEERRQEAEAKLATTERVCGAAKMPEDCAKMIAEAFMEQSNRSAGEFLRANVEMFRELETGVGGPTAAPPEQAPGMETCARDVWRCSGCGEMLDNPPGTAWRWNGKAWEHRCPERDPQAGYEPAKNFGPRVAPEQAPRADDGALPALPWPVTANAMHACSVDFPDVESDAMDNVCGVFTIAECLTGDLAQVTCLDCLRSIARQRTPSNEGTTTKAPASDPRCARVLEGGKICGHLLSVHRDGCCADVVGEGAVEQVHRCACSGFAYPTTDAARPADVGETPANPQAGSPDRFCSTCAHVDLVALGVVYCAENDQSGPIPMRPTDSCPRWEANPRPLPTAPRVGPADVGAAPPASTGTAPSHPRTLTPEQLLDADPLLFDLTVRASNGIQMAGIKTVRDLVAMTRAEVAALSNMNEKAADDVAAVLAGFGLAFREGPVAEAPREIDVTHFRLDAPDGARIILEGWWYERQGSKWTRKEPFKAPDLARLGAVASEEARRLAQAGDRARFGTHCLNPEVCNPDKPGGLGCVCPCKGCEDMADAARTPGAGESEGTP